MQLAAQNHVRSIAFPSISTGAYGFPIKRAAATAVTTVTNLLASLSEIEKVTFVCFSKNDYAIYNSELTKDQA